MMRTTCVFGTAGGYYRLHINYVPYMAGKMVYIFDIKRLN